MVAAPESARVPNLPKLTKWLAVFAVLSAFAVPASAARAADSAWVEMAPDGGSIVRVLTPDGQCPVLGVDGRQTAMSLRAAPADLAPRANKASMPGSASFPGRVLPLPTQHINRIVIIGDSGCRMKAADKEWQACNVPAKWPFAQVAAQAALKHPDLVLHVGDYHYRENPCNSAAEPDCAGAVSGYGEQTWRTDFLDPAVPLLTAARRRNG